MKNLLVVIISIIFLSCNEKEPLPAPSNVVASDATLITQTSFSANWSVSTDATDYLLDVSTSNAYDSFVPGYNTLSVGDVTSYAVDTEINAGTNYYYRVRASNSTSTTPISNTISLITIPEHPIAIDATYQMEDSFIANWEESIGSGEYFLDVSTSSNFESFLSGFENLSVGDITAIKIQTDLVVGETYYYRIRASNESGTSSNSNTISITIVEFWRWVDLISGVVYIYRIWDHPILMNPEEYLEVRDEQFTGTSQRIFFTHFNNLERINPLSLSESFTFKVNGATNEIFSIDGDGYAAEYEIFMNEIENGRDVLVTAKMYYNPYTGDFFETDITILSNGYPGVW